jgi:hypothetical protein
MAFAGSFGKQVVATAQTDKVLGGTGRAGDYLSHIVVQPTTTAASCIVKDGGTAFHTLTAGTLADLSARTIPFNTCAEGAGFTVTTVNCVVTAYGSFT